MVVSVMVYTKTRTDTTPQKQQSLVLQPQSVVCTQQPQSVVCWGHVGDWGTPHPGLGPDARVKSWLVREEKRM